MADSFAPGSPRSGHGARVRLAALRERHPRVFGALFAVLAALPALVVFRGFTVDDALVSARVASNIARGHGYRFNPSGPEVDAVTPLGWAHLMALGGSASPLEMLERGRLLGALGWLGAAAVLGVFLVQSERFGRRTALALLAASTPAAAWATSGMETGVVTLFATLALARGTAGALAGGVAAALRPELVPFVCVLGVGTALLEGGEPRARAGFVLRALLFSLGPALLVALARSMWFGTPAPLALSAKPPDLGPGTRYAIASAFGTSVVLVLLAPVALRRAPPAVVRIVLAVAAHFVALALAGGDWMPLYRLAVPVLPAALFAGAELAGTSTRPWHGARVGAAIVVSAVVGFMGAWPARTVLANRIEFVAALRAVLRDAKVTATVDAGLVGASTEGTVFDLAGVTDPTVAHLPGGHTTKRVPEGLFESRGVDHAVLELAPGTRARVPWTSSSFGRFADAWFASTPWVADEFELVAEVPLGRTPYRYLVIARRGVPGQR